MPQPEVGADPDQFLTAFQMVRQHAEIEEVEASGDLLRDVAQAVQRLTTQGVKLSMFVCEAKHFVREASTDKHLRIEDVWQVPLHEDPEARGVGLLVVGSQSGPYICDIEVAVKCPLEVE